MKCPVCVQTDLVMSERKGIEIDYCPACRGVWLDRGELDKLIERSFDSETRREPVASPPPSLQPAYRSNAPLPEPSQSPGRDFYWDGRKWKRKKSWFEEIFD